MFNMRPEKFVVHRIAEFGTKNIVITICTVIINRMLNGANKPLFFLKSFTNRFGVRFQNFAFLNHVVFLFFTSILSNKVFMILG